MNKQEVIKEMCSLVTEVGCRAFNSKHAHDCFCSCAVDNNPIVGKEVMEFIRCAVIEKLKKVQMDPNT